MKSLIATHGTDAFIEAANRVIRREIAVTLDAGRAITVLLDGRVTQLTQAEYRQLEPTQPLRQKGR